MYKFITNKPTSITVNNSYEGETIEQKVRRIMLNNEPIEDTAPLLYTAKKDGVINETNIRNDKWEQMTESREKGVLIRMKRQEDFNKKTTGNNPEQEGASS